MYRGKGRNQPELSHSHWIGCSQELIEEGGWGYARAIGYRQNVPRQNFLDKAKRPRQTTHCSLTKIPVQNIMRKTFWGVLSKKTSLEKKNLRRNVLGKRCKAKIAYFVAEMCLIIVGINICPWYFHILHTVYYSAGTADLHSHLRVLCCDGAYRVKKKFTVVFTVYFLLMVTVLINFVEIFFTLDPPKNY